ncbi:hypothetical protein V8F20_007721 [Naviculisporaceae sp. PSN 640]
MASLLTTVGETVAKEIEALRRRSLPSQPERGGRGDGDGHHQAPTEQQHEIAAPLKPGDNAPQSKHIHFPSEKPVIIVFLRNCGSPFAEKTFRLLTAFSNHNKKDIHCIAITQASSQQVTDEWVIANGGEWDVEVLTDSSRELYAQWGLGLASSWWKVFGPVQLAEAYKLGVHEGIWGTGAVAPSLMTRSNSDSGSPNQTTNTEHAEGDESGGNKWQMGGVFAVDEEGIVRWAHVETSASDIPDFKQAKEALEEAARRKKEDRENAARGGWENWDEIHQQFVP